MSDSEVYEQPEQQLRALPGVPFSRLPSPRVVWPKATVIVHFHDEVDGDGYCTVYRQELELVAGSGYAQAIDVLLNQNAEGQSIPLERRPRGEECDEGHVY